MSSNSFVLFAADTQPSCWLPQGVSRLPHTLPAGRMPHRRDVLSDRGPWDDVKQTNDTCLRVETEAVMK
jgi:hypothetical protein